MTDNDLKEAFSLLDKDGNKTIDAEEFRVVMNSIDTEFDAKDIEEMVRMADKNNDGEIDFVEFKAVMKTKKGKDVSDKQRILREMKEEL
jgi:calmodulin